MDQAWKGWKKHFDFYLTATEYEEKSNKVKTCLLLSCIGQKGREIYETFEFDTADPENPMKFDLVTKKFELYCTPERTSRFLDTIFLLTSKQKDRHLASSSHN